MRKVAISTSDPMLARIEQLSNSFRAKGKYFFFGHLYRRYYSTKELSNADLLFFEPNRIFEPAGEECGTQYGDEVACPQCGAGAPQSSPLFLTSRRIPKSADISQTIAGEIVVTARFVSKVREAQLQGVDFGPVLLQDKDDMPSEDFFQLLVHDPSIELNRATRVGEDHFDKESYGHCPCGKLLGLNRLSEVFVNCQGGFARDVLATTQFLGARSGFLRPNRLLLLSPKGHKVLVKAELRGLRIEVAYCR